MTKYPKNRATVGFPLVRDTPRSAIAELAKAYKGRTVDRIVVISISPYDVREDPEMFAVIEKHMGSVGAPIDFEQMMAQDFDDFADQSGTNITLTLP